MQVQGHNHLPGGGEGEERVSGGTLQGFSLQAQHPVLPVPWETSYQSYQLLALMAGHALPAWSHSCALMAPPASESWCSLP